MSPIGRVFIVLNLVLAGGFAFVAGDHLKNQHNWKVKYEQADEARKADNTRLSQQIADLEVKLGNAETAKSTFQTQVDSLRNELANKEDDIKRLTALTDSQAADLKKAVSLQEANQTTIASLVRDSQEANKAAIAAISEKDEAIRAKDAAEGKQAELEQTIAALNATVSKKDLQIAELSKDNEAQKLLVSVARANGFIPSMAAPTLSGTVTMASGRLCTISVAENPGNVDIQDQIERNPFHITIYDASGFKAEAVATKYEPSANAILCNVILTKDGKQIKTGDSASTKP
ncbi:MAG TPA: hypothetical protein ENI87_10150 [bacterium]|nr:hypothetical protein [bacterium]